jgi:hypothetical protein
MSLVERAESRVGKNRGGRLGSAYLLLDLGKPCEIYLALSTAILHG